MPELTRLQREIAERILHIVRDDALEPGARLNENDMSRRLNVSRTPIRAALAHLAAQGVVRRHSNKGIELVAAPDALPDEATASDADEVALIRLAHDREAGLIPDAFSEMEVMRRYELSRPEVQRLLARLADLGLLERKRGYGWRFLLAPRDPAARAESYRYRLLIEPAGILEPGFAVTATWLDEMRARHLAALEQPWRDNSPIAFFEMNAAFHEGLAAASGNRFIHDAVRRQSQLRRLSNYDWVFGLERVRINCTEHLQIMDYIAADDLEIASTLMRRHLSQASLVGRDAATGEKP